MTTFARGVAFAADYGQDRVRSLGAFSRSHTSLLQPDRLARREAFNHLNCAISRAVLAQLDDQELLCDSLCSDAMDEDDDELFMHCGGMECYFCTFPKERL